MYLENYFYVRDITGIITSIVDSAGNLHVSYKYDAYGKVQVDSSESDELQDETNKMLYKGYYYDFETGYYYLNSRYYFPEYCRFISVDSVDYLDPEHISGLNLFAYCVNNPVMYSDVTGHFAVLAIFATLLIGALVGGVVGGITAEIIGQDFWSGFAGGAISGVISTIGMALAVVTGGIGGLAIAGLFGFVAGFGGSVVQQGMEFGWRNIDMDNAVYSGILSAAINMITFGAMNFSLRDSLEMFGNFFDKSLSFGMRFVNALSISGPSVLATGIFSIPATIFQSIGETTKYFIEKYQSEKKRNYGIKPAF